MAILTVSQLNRYVAFRLHEDTNLQTVFVRGEIANFKRNFKSGHCYFSVKDEDASVRAVMFRMNAERLPFEPKDGMDVLLQGRVTLYEKGGDYQIQVLDLQPDGVGAQALALQQRREKLAKLGFFDPARKRQLPKLPQKIGIVTSRSGAALHDMLQILERRYPLAKVCIYPAIVQGDAAPASIAEALRTAGADRCDIILMGRGGGSNEDLSAFQSEAVAEAVFHAPVPVISAVGHETDHCIADEVADLRAPTPSAAAELAVPDKAALLAMLADTRSRLDSAVTSQLTKKQQTLDALLHRLERQSPAQRVQLSEEKLTALTARLRNAAENTVRRAEQQWQLAAGRLEAVSPVAILQRGYALAYRGDTLVRQAESLHPGDTLNIRFSEGSITATVNDVMPDHGGDTDEI